MTRNEPENPLAAYIRTRDTDLAADDYPKTYTFADAS